jgi:peptide/nickel transport system permease protein
VTALTEPALAGPSAEAGVGSRGWLRACRSLGVWLSVSLIILAIFGPVLAPQNPDAVNVGQRLLGPDAQHWFGTDGVGADVFSRVLAGAQVTLGAVAVVIASGAVIGAVIGTAAALGGRVADELLMRLTDIGLAFPPLILALGLAAALGPSLQSAVIALSITWWPRYARLFRTMIVTAAREDYVAAAREMGASRVRIIWRHLLPATTGTLLVQVTVDVANVVLTLSALSFIGVGAQPPQPEWGAMIAEGQTYLPIIWWPVLFPGLALMVTGIAFSLAGDWLRDWFDQDQR